MSRAGDDDSVTSGYTAVSGDTGTSANSRKESPSLTAIPTPDPNTQLNVMVQIKALRNIPINHLTTSDPYVLVRLGKVEVHRTKYVFKNINPKFTEQHDNSFVLRCTVKELTDAKGLTFNVNNFNLVLDDDPLCKLRIPPKVFFKPTGELREFKLKQVMEQKKYPVIDVTGGKGKSSYIRLRLKPAPEPAGLAKAMAVVDEATTAKRVSEKIQTYKKSYETAFDSQYQQQKVDEALGNSYKTKKVEDLKIETISLTMDLPLPDREKHASDSYTRVTINAEHMKTAIKSFRTAKRKAPLFEQVVFYYIKMSDTKEDRELANAIKNHKSLQMVHCINSQNIVKSPASIPPILEAIGELPGLEELELRMSGHKKELPRNFLKFISQYSKSLKSLLLSNVAIPEVQIRMLFNHEKSQLESLVLWNIKLDFRRLKVICEELNYNTTMKRLEIWCSDLGSNFGISLAKMLEANKSLETMVVSHVGLYGTSCIALMDALKTKNSTLRNLSLLSVSYNDKDTVSKAVMQMMNDNKALESISVTYESMKEEDCYQYSKDIKRGLLLRKFLQQKKEYDLNKCACTVM